MSSTLIFFLGGCFLGLLLGLCLAYLFAAACAYPRAEHDDTTSLNG